MYKGTSISPEHRLQMSLLRVYFNRIIHLIFLMNCYISIAQITTNLGGKIFLPVCVMLSESVPYHNTQVLKLGLILLNLPAQFIYWRCLSCRLQGPDDNTSVPGVISLPGEHTLNQKGPVVLLSGDFSSLTHHDMWSISHFLGCDIWIILFHRKKKCSFIHLYANYRSLWI